MGGILSDGASLEEMDNEEGILALVGLGEGIWEADEELIEESEETEISLEGTRPEVFYLRDVYEKGVNLLTAEEERTLAQKMKAGDAKSRDILIEKNLRLVIKIAKQHLGRGLEFLDLIEEGNIGLIKGVDRFKVSKGYRISTYVSWWIRQEINKALTYQAHTVGISNGMFEFLCRRWRVIKKLKNKIGRVPDIEEIARHMEQENKNRAAEKLTAKAYNEGFTQLLKRLRHAEEIIMMQNTVSLESPLGENSDGTVGGLLPDDEEKVPEAMVCNREIFGVILPSARRILSEKELNIIDRRFGFGDDGRVWKRPEIGDVYGVVPERIRQIEIGALAKMRAHIEYQTAIRQP